MSGNLYISHQEDPDHEKGLKVNILNNGIFTKKELKLIGIIVSKV